MAAEPVPSATEFARVTLVPEPTATPLVPAALLNAEHFVGQAQDRHDAAPLAVVTRQLVATVEAAVHGVVVLERLNRGVADATIHTDVSGVFSAPTADGKCDAAALQIIPTSEPCAKTQALILQKGKALGNLAGVPLLRNAANAQILLIPAANNSCVLVALRTVYTD